MKKLLFLVVLSLMTTMSYAQQGCVGQSGQVRWDVWMGYDGMPDSSEIAQNEYYPDRPDQSIVLGSLSSPFNFNDNYASLIRGFISVPTTASYFFNITGDDDSQFYLSTDDTKENLSRKAHVYSWTYLTEHQKDSTQSSELIQLQAGQNYYFEIHHYEGGWQDHVNLHWRIPAIPDTDTVWQIIDYNYLKEYDCPTSICPPRGTPCDDGNALTTDDQQDGHCNCVGVYPSANACVGERGLVEAYYYDNIDGNYIENDLITAPNFPLIPDRKEELKGAYGPLNPYDDDDYGTLLQGYLTVPVTGLYEFNITGDDQTFFFLSKNDSIEYKQSSQALVFYNTAEGQHDRSSFQSVGPLTLEVGKYYYFEIRHKENGWRDYFTLTWKTPFQNEGVWKKVPNFYLFDYKCEISCIAQGTPCDDGNIYTNNDQIDANCNCVGVPCTGPDCDNLFASYDFYKDADHTTSLVSSEEFSWLSCGVNSVNPNSARAANTNWISYDFAKQYKFQGSRVWNYNVTGETTKGFKNVVFDYSVDGTTWTPLPGTYTWAEAPGLSDYAGFNGPNFNDLKARYILISSIDNWGDATCSGFSKVTFDAIHCDEKDTPCDDLDPLTSYDKFDDSCNCRGIDINCASDTLNLIKESLADGAFKAIMRIEAESLIPSTNNISFTAGNSIVLLPGFEASNEAVFTADIANCVQTAFVANELKTKEEESSTMLFDDEEKSNVKKVIFRLNEAGDVKLLLKDSNGETIVTIIDAPYQNLGTQTKYIPTAKLEKGTYTIELSINDNVMKESFTID